MRMSLFAMYSSLCSVALFTVTPPICTGSSTAFGLSVPVRPTVIDDVEQLRARLARLELVGDRPARIARDDAEPLLRRESSTLTTTPSIS